LSVALSECWRQDCTPASRPQHHHRSRCGLLPPWFRRRPPPHMAIKGMRRAEASPFFDSSPSLSCSAPHPCLCSAPPCAMPTLMSHPVFNAKTRCSSYICPGSNCHTYGQNVSTEYQCLYHTVSYYKNYYKSRKD
jgi:hypothetical protein